MSNQFQRDENGALKALKLSDLIQYIDKNCESLDQITEYNKGKLDQIKDLKEREQAKQQVESQDFMRYLNYNTYFYLKELKNLSILLEEKANEGDQTAKTILDQCGIQLTDK